MGNDVAVVEVYPNGGGTGHEVVLASQGTDGGSPGSFRSQRNQLGAGQVTAPLDDTLLGNLVEGALLSFLVNGTRIRHVVRVEQVHQVDVTEGEDAASERTVTGVGLLIEWGDGILPPVNGYDRRPFADQVRYDFTHPDLDDSAWHGTVYPILAPGDEDPGYPVVVQRHSIPMEQPDPFAQWVATVAEDVPSHSMPLGSMFFRKPEDLDGSGEAISLSYSSADDQFFEYAGGVFNQQGELDPGFSYEDTYRAARRVTLGQQLLRAIEVVAAPRPFTTLNITGLINSFFVVDSLDSILVDTTFVSQTGTPPFVSDGWKCIDNFADPTWRPGFTFGAMWISVWTRMQSEGEMLQWAVGFTATHDSAGNPWDLQIEWVYDTLTDGWTMLQQCTETAVDVDYTIDLATGVRTLLAYNKGTVGTATGIEVRPAAAPGDAGANVTRLEHDSDAKAVIDRLAYRHANGFSKVEQAPAAGFPRRSGRLALGTVNDPAEAARIATVNMTALALPQRSVSVAVDTVGGDVPSVDYREFDTVLAPDRNGTLVETVVDAVAWELGGDGFATPTPELNDPAKTAQERTQVTLRRMTPGTLGGRSSNASPAGSDVDGIQSGKLPKYRDIKANFSGTAVINRITGFQTLKERRRLTNYLVTAQPQPDDSDIGPVTGPTTVNMYTPNGTIVAFAILPKLPNWSDEGEPTYQVEVRLGGGFYQEGQKFFWGLASSGGHYNIVVEVASTDPL